MSGLVLVVVLALSACSSEVKMKDSPVPTCSTLQQCDARDGARVEVVGVYTVHEVPPRRKADDDSPRPVLLMLGADQGPFLEPYWHAAAVRPAEEISRYQGKSVRVRGTYHREQPADPSGPGATMGGPCLHPVESIELAD